MGEDRTQHCPECGRSFSRRGLAGHRRLKHGVGMDPGPEGSATPRPAFRTAHALPSGAIGPQEPPAPLPTVAEDLHSMRLLLERIETRLDRLEGKPEAGAGEPGAHSAGPAPEREEGELGALRKELTRVFEEIARAKDEARRGAAGGDASDETRRDAERAAAQRLGVLRRRQAHILYRLRARENGDFDTDGLALGLL